MSGGGADSTEEFKDAVNAYIELHDEITKSSKQLREIKQQKDAVGEIILRWMRTHSVDECDLPDGKLVRKTSKRSGILKKESILAELKKLTGDDGRAGESLQNIFNMRNVVEKEILSRTVKKST